MRKSKVSIRKAAGLALVLAMAVGCTPKRSELLREAKVVSEKTEIAKPPQFFKDFDPDDETTLSYCFRLPPTDPNYYKDYCFEITRRHFDGDVFLDTYFEVEPPVEDGEIEKEDDAPPERTPESELSPDIRMRRRFFDAEQKARRVLMEGENGKVALVECGGGLFRHGFIDEMYSLVWGEAFWEGEDACDRGVLVALDYKGKVTGKAYLYKD